MAPSLSFNAISFVLIVVSLVFLILSTISVPVVSSFSLASTSNYKYGIFGYCDSDSCSKALYPYTLSTKDEDISWLLSGATRDTLEKAFILCPIAAGLNFLCLVLITLSFWFLSTVLFALIFNILSFLATALIAVIVVIVFHPHVAWAAWILIGAAAANIISIVMLFVTLKFSSSYGDVSDTESNRDLTRFDEKYNDTTITTLLPPVSGGSKNNGYDNNSSFSNDYEFKMQHAYQVAPTMTDSSVFNSNPHLAKDFTQQSNSLESKGSHYDDYRANLVNGPNTPISGKQQIAPNFTPVVATPTVHDGPRSKVPAAPAGIPYPMGSPLQKPPYSGTDMSVFEHHPEVEGHRPFTELADDETPAHLEQQRTSHGSGSLGSDVDSDFTSVSQRAINPNYRPNYYEQNPQGMFGGGNPQYPQSSPYQPQFQQMPPQAPGPQVPLIPNNYSGPQQRFQKGPTIADNALNANPDFAIGAPGKRKPGYRPTMGPPIPRHGMGPTGRPSGPGRRDGPYGMI